MRRIILEDLIWVFLIFFALASVIAALDFPFLGLGFALLTGVVVGLLFTIVAGIIRTARRRASRVPSRR